jgi:hypothetical protein
MNINIQSVLTNNDYDVYLFDAPIDPYLNIIPSNRYYDYNDASYVWLDSNNINNTWYYNFGFTDPSYSLALSNPTTTSSTTIYAPKSIKGNQIYINNTNNFFSIYPLYDASGGLYNNMTNATTTTNNGLYFTLDLDIKKGPYTKEDVRDSMNRALTANELTFGSYVNTDGKNTLIRININKVFNGKDYALVFFDSGSFTQCNFGPNSSVETTTTDTTVGWILGFRSNTIYYLTPENSVYNASKKTYYYGNTNTLNLFTYDTTTKISTLIGDTSVSVNLYNYLLIVLDDYTQNHLNDGLVTTINADLDVALPSYANKRSYKCDPTTNTYSVSNAEKNLTNKQLYSSNQILKTQKNKYVRNTISTGPYIQDIFGIIPIKTAGLQNGQSYIEFGGTLQIQERVYFGPVNIRRMTVKLMTDKGNILDLNGQNWSFSLITEQLYNPSK